MYRCMTEDETSYNVDFSGKPKKKHDPEGSKMVGECMAIMMRSLALRKVAEKQFVRITEFHEKHKGKNPDDTPWQEKEQICAEAEKLMGEVSEGIRQLKKLDDDYEELRERVNRYYGTEIMKKHYNSTGIEEMYKEILERGDADWWKT